MPEEASVHLPVHIGSLAAQAGMKGAWVEAAQHLLSTPPFLPHMLSKAMRQHCLSALSIPQCKGMMDRL